MSTISYILYLLITGTMIVLFVMIIVVSCFGKREQERIRVHPEGIHPGLGAHDLSESEFDPDYIPGFTVGDDSDDENPITLT